jgi:tetratricopeptide (TPR) repeat protein
MELAQTEYLKSEIEIENPQHYAAKIYKIDKYYGSLAWSDIFLNNIDFSRGEAILKEIILAHKKRPEAYLKLWNFYYHTTKDYNSALQIAEKAFIYNGKSEYSVILSLNYARSLYKTGKIRNSLELLQLEYTKHSLFTVILYHYGRFCIKSKDQYFLGSGIGALEESLNTTSESRHGQIYYWLSKAYLLAEEKLEAFACAKKGIPIISNYLDKLENTDRDFERTLCKKLNELKDIIKDFHIHIISINMLEKLLEDSPVQVPECKLYISSVKDFDVLESFLYEAKMWWKSGNSKKAKEILYNKLTFTRVRMKAYFLLAEFFESEGNYEEMLYLCKEIVRKCRSPMIPVQVWIYANMVYARCLIKQKKASEALLVYKSLAQVQPIPFIPDVRYTRELQRACTKEDLNNVLAKLGNKEYKYSYLNVDLTDYQMQRSKLVCSKQYLASNLLGEDEDETEIPSEYSKNGSTDRSDSDLVGSRAPEPLPRSRISSVPCGDSANIGFSVTTAYEFLYKIGKTCAKYDLNYKEGIQAIHDFLNIHHYWTRDGIEIHEELKVKAKFWLGILYYKSGQLDITKEVFKDILSMLFQLGRVKMSNEVLRILTDTKFSN